MAQPKNSQLANLASQFPAMTQRSAGAQQAQARMAASQQIQQQAQGAEPQRPLSAAMMGAELYTAQAAASRDAAQRAQKGVAAVGQMELQRQKEEQQKLLFERSIGLQQTARKHEQQLQKLSSNVKRNLYDRAMKFEKDEIGRTRWKTSQLMDYALRKTQRAQDYRKLEQSVGQMQKRRTQLLKTSQAKIQQALKQEFAKTEAARERSLTERLQKAEAEIQKKIAKMKAEAAENSSMWQMGGEIIGMALAAVAVAAAPVTAGASLALASVAVPAGRALGGAAGTYLGAENAPERRRLSREEIRAQIRGGR